MKRREQYLIAAHPIQRALLAHVAGKGIDRQPLRGIGAVIGAKVNNGVPLAPQQIKHHLTAMVKYGFLDIVGGKYRVGSTLKRSTNGRRK